MESFILISFSKLFTRPAISALLEGGGGDASRSPSYFGRGDIFVAPEGDFDLGAAFTGE